MHVGLVLPFRFDPARLRADLALVATEEWSPHYNQRDFGGDWRGVALRSPNGRVNNLSAPFMAASTFLDTPLMERCAYFREAVAAFLCPLKSVRLLSLAAGSFIREHVDNALVYEDGEMRVHIPVQTSADVEFYVAGERLNLEEGCSYYVNVNLPHRITNRGSAARIHLIIDVEVNGWVHELVREARARQSAIPRTSPRAEGFDDFASLVFDDPALRERLSSFRDRTEFIQATVGLARECGFDVVQADVEAALHVNVIGGCAVRRPPRVEAGHSKIGWTPIKLHLREQACFLEWLYTGRQRFTEPSFEETIRSCLQEPFSVAFRQMARLDAIDDAELAAHTIAPSGFIFHMSRSGSTLVAQMIAASPETVVMSEPAPLDEILQAHLRLPELRFEEQAACVRRLVLALGQRRTGVEEHYFVKLNPWHVHRLHLLRAAFPDTPFLFLFRCPEQVMLSHAQNPSILSFPGGIPDPRVLSLAIEDIARIKRDEWCAQVLTLICESALTLGDDPKTLFVNYAALPGAVHWLIAPHFGLTLNPDDLAQIRERTRVDSKSGFLSSDGEPRDSRADASSRVRQLCAGKLAHLYTELRRAADNSRGRWKPEAIA